MHCFRQLSSIDAQRGHILILLCGAQAGKSNSWLLAAAVAAACLLSICISACILIKVFTKQAGLAGC